MDDELGMHVVQSTANLPNKKRNPLLRQSHPPFQLVFHEMLVHVLISCVLTDEVDGPFIMEATVQLSDMWVVDKRVDLDLAEDVFLHFQAFYLLFVEHLQRTDEAALPLDRQKHLTVCPFANLR